MDAVFAQSIAKNVDEPEANEDCWEIAHSGFLAVLSDGASESFDSRSWAKLLVRHCIESGGSAGVDGVASAALQLYQELYDPEQLSWAKQFAYERGSFATLLSCRHEPVDDTLSIRCIGDSIAILFDVDRVVCTHGYQTSAQFGERPNLISTRLEMNEILFPTSDSDSSSILIGLRDLEHPRLLMMTDALGAWALRRIEEGKYRDVTDLTRLDDLSFRAFVIETRERGEMRTDDTTLLAFDL